MSGVSELRCMARAARNLIAASTSVLPNPNNSSAEPATQHLICLHGYMSDASVFADLKNYFQDKFLVLCVSLQTFSCGIAEMAQSVEDLLLRKNITNYSIISHSLGAVVGLYHQKFIAKHLARKTICAAAPLFGSHLSNFAIGPARTELHPASKVLKQIHSKLSTTNDNIVFVHAQNDVVIINAFSSSVQSPQVVINCGHLGVLYHPQFIQLCVDTFAV